MKKLIALLLALALLAAAGCSMLNGVLSRAEEPAGQAGGQSSQPQAVEPAQGAPDAAQIENKADLSLDKAAFDQGERIEVTLNFSKLNQDTAVIMIVSSDTPHDPSVSVQTEGVHREYRYLSDFSELPFYMWAPEENGLFDVRVYSSYENGEELACASAPSPSLTRE